MRDEAASDYARAIPRGSPPGQARFHVRAWRQSVLGLIVVSIPLDADFLRQEDLNIAGSMQNAKYLDAIGKRPVEDEIISMASDGKEP
jgi:hypothetical protein